RTPMVRQVDALVTGAGPGGYPAAIRAAQLGKRVLLVERDRLGGECLNYGCIPSKALIHTANLIHAIERAAERGVETGPVKVDMARLQQWKSAVVQRLSNGVGQLCKGNGVDVLAGHASFTGPDRATVRTSSGAEEIAFTDAIIATGGRPSDLPAFRFDGKRVLSTKEALELPRIPLNLAVIGGAISGLEIGTPYAKLGTRVVAIEILAQILTGIVPAQRGGDGPHDARHGDRRPYDGDDPRRRAEVDRRGVEGDDEAEAGHHRRCSEREHPEPVEQTRPSPARGRARDGERGQAA